MDNPTTNDGTIDPNVTEYGISNWVNTSDLTGYRYCLGVSANILRAISKGLEMVCRILSTISHEIKPFK